ncbi:MAG TPA: N-6 DNA methylase [Bacteroidales bacterium]|nr:N-6 DNA methylase [Bacteroidales bacterium]
MRNIFSNSYPGVQVVLDDVLAPIFGEYISHNQDILASYPEKQNLAQAANIKQIKYVASFDLGVKPLAIFDIVLSSNARLSHSRVNIQRVVRSVMDVYTGALMFFHYEDNQTDWRISFVEKEDTLTRTTSTKRYTYLVGEDQAVRTVTDRFKVLADTPNKTVEALREAFSVETLTKEFYKELFDWYQWAIDPNTGVTFPNNTNIAEDDREKIDEKIIRLITRLLFVWFIKQKGLVPKNLFDVEELKNILIDFNPESKESGNYYNAILQNLFFATLNKEINDRAFAKEKDNRREVKTLYRYQEMFIEKKEENILKLFHKVPFLNGGLFECLDKTIGMDGVEYAYDGFSRNAIKSSNGNFKHRAFLPNELFFHAEKGIIPLLKKYNFTVEENSSDEIQVALDPELLGKVFENLLGAYNPETRETARKQSGSFYTPREIVDYMVIESLITFLVEKIPNLGVETIKELFYVDELPKELSDNYNLCVEISKALKNVRIIDPACGSGAFPMGILNKMVPVLEKLDRERNYSIYEQKLHLIEECIYGVDIQNIAVQISKLRFFISLICEQNERNTNPHDNYGIKTLPNLETKFVSANSLVGLAKKEQQLNLFENPEIEVTKEELLKVRKEHFFAPTSYEKKKLRDKDAELREKLAELLEENGDFAPENAKQIAKWNPYDQNTSSSFFDPEWMFGIKKGFDIVIGNPPYISTKGVSAEDKKIYEKEFGFSDDTYNLFTFKGLELLTENGSLTYIIPKTFWTTQTKRNMRDLILSKTIRYIFDTANPFDSVMVDTCITQVLNKPFDSKNEILFLDGSKSIKNPTIFIPVKQSVYCNTQNSVIFKPTEQNIKIWNLYGQKVKDLYNTWWDRIKTSREILQNATELKKYRESLKPGDIALLGCLTEGGQGLATANNGKYIAVRKSTKWAKNILESRPKKLAEAIQKYKIKLDEIDNLSPQEFLDIKTEKEIVAKFDSLKEKYGRDIFGQGYIYRLIDDSEMADVDTLTIEEKENGIDLDKNYYVPYDKGDKDGNRWYLETPFAIAWSKENVHFLKTNSGKKGVGMPVLRNPQYYFKEGFCWTDINSTFLKARLKTCGVFDVVSMSLFTMTQIPDWYFVCLINSKFMSLYVDNFINNTSHFQINDARQVPIIIPTEVQLSQFKMIFESADIVKRQQFSSKILEEKAVEKLNYIQEKLDTLVYKLYAI